MNIDHRAVAVGIVLSAVSVHYFGGNEVGFSYATHDEKTLVSSSTHPFILAWGAAGILLYLLLMTRVVSAEPVGSVGLIRRFAAFLIDIYVAVLALGSIFALIPLWVEAMRTGHFEWRFERTYSVPSDSYVFPPLSVIGVLIFFFYFAYPLTIGKQSPGEYALRLRTTAANKIKSEGLTWGQVFKRSIYAGIAMGLWPYTLWKGRDTKGRTWYDRASECDVTLVKY